MEKYDVFISYRSLNRTWVEALCRNLGKCGFKPFLDCWCIIPGDNLDRALLNAIEVSSAAIFVCTPEARESKWVMWDECSTFRNRSKSDETVRLIPLRFGAVSSVSFLDNLIGVDFSNPAPEAYRAAFGKLVCGLKNEAPGANPERHLDNCELEIPAPISAEPDLHSVTPLGATDQHMVNEVFDHLSYHRPVALLAQDGWDVSLIYSEILARARRHYANNRVLHLAIPLYDKATQKQYFAEINRQLGLVGDASPIGFSGALRARMEESTSKFFLLITRMEDGNNDRRYELAGVLRDFLHRENVRLNVVLCGAERLAELKFRFGDLSLLNTASVVWWPDPTYVDLLAWQHERYPEDPEISEVEAQSLLVLCGAHPRLIHEALILRHNGKTLAQIGQELTDSATLTAAFTVCRSLAHTDRERICKWLQCEHEQVAPYDPWPEDEVLRKLFWKNLLTRSACKQYFQWRCSLVQEVGRRILKCGGL